MSETSEVFKYSPKQLQEQKNRADLEKLRDPNTTVSLPYNRLCSLLHIGASTLYRDYIQTEVYNPITDPKNKKHLVITGQEFTALQQKINAVNRARY